MYYRINFSGHNYIELSIRVVHDTMENFEV